MGNVKIIAASAGSGKTYRLAYEYVKSVIRDPGLYRHILAVTFTNKATGEMASRILERLHELADTGSPAVPAAPGSPGTPAVPATPGSPGTPAEPAAPGSPGTPARPPAPSPYLERLLAELPGFDEARIRTQAARAQRLILHDFSRFAVLTIDRFFQRLIRSFMRELGVDAGFNLELETDSLLEMAADALIEGSAGDERLRERLFSATRERLEQGRAWDIRRSLVSLGSELFGEEFLENSGGFSMEGSEDFSGSVVGSVAGSVVGSVIEKAASARALMKDKAIEAQDIMTGAGLAPEDFKGRSRGLGSWLAKVAAGEFIPLSAAAREAAGSDDPTAWFAKNFLQRGGPGSGLDHAAAEGLIARLRPLLIELVKIYSDNHRLVTSAGLIRENWHNYMLLKDLQRQVEALCRDQSIVPIAQTNRMIARLVGGNDSPFIFERAGTHFSRFFIDEFQDTSRLQWANFVPLLSEGIASSEGTPVMLIGDVKQAIYRWRGGDWQILSKRVEEIFGADRVERETLETNFRTRRRVVEFNNFAVGRMVEAAGETLDGMLEKAREAGNLSAHEEADLKKMLFNAYSGHVQKARDEADDEGYVTLTVYDADNEGVATPPVIERIEELQSRGFRPGDIAVLVRTNTQAARVAEMLLERKHSNASSPYRYDVVTAEALTVGAAAVSRFIIACLSLAVDPADTIQRAIYNRWLGRDFDTPLDTSPAAKSQNNRTITAMTRESDPAFFARLATLSPEEAFEEVVLRFGLADRAADVAYIQAIHGQIVSFSSRQTSDLPLFLKWWHEHGAAASIAMQQEVDAITISTIHKAKGLEYKAVIVPYLSWSTGPETRGRPLVVWAGGEAGDGADGGGQAGGDDEAGGGAGNRVGGERGNGNGRGDGGGADGATYSLPINYKESMSRSYFSDRYYREQVLAAIDATNLFYVAVTRAEFELHLMVPATAAGGRGNVGGLLCNVLNITDKTTSWGAPFHPENRGVAAEEKGLLRGYPTSRPGARVRLRLPSARYFEQADGEVGGEAGFSAVGDVDFSGGGAGFSAGSGAGSGAGFGDVFSGDRRRFGVLMHRAFERAASASDVREAMDRMLAEALLSPEEYAHLQSISERAMANPLVAEWFGGGWTQVRNESDIVLPRGWGGPESSLTTSPGSGPGLTTSLTAAPGPSPKSGRTTPPASAAAPNPSPSTRRPDRVMIRDGRAVVVDYKFGRRVLPGHASQLRGYMRLLREMGYSNVQGHIWYVLLDRIDRVV